MIGTGLQPTFNLVFAGATALDQRVTFSRTTNATLIGSDGTLQYAPHNLLTYSEQFDNAVWTVTAATISANAVSAPNGTQTADQLVETVGTGTLPRLPIPITLEVGKFYSASVYAKEVSGSSKRYLQVYFNASFATVPCGANFDLATGTVTFSGGIASATVESAGNGWWRCTINTTVVTSALSGFRIALVDSPTQSLSLAWNPDGTGSMYLWGAQLNVGALQPYYQTEASAYYGPRFDYDPVTLEPKGLLIEEQRTNLALNSGDVLSGTGGVVVANQITAPDGSLSDFFQEDTSNGEHYAGDRTPSVTAGTTYTWSFYAKLGLTGEARRVCVRTGGQGPGNVVFDLETGGSTVLAPVVSSGISSAGNGWFRCWIVYTATGTGAAVFRQQLAKGTNTVYTGDGTSGLFFWGAQLEVGAFPTSYIPTTTAAATRAADVASVTGDNFSNWYNPVEGTMVAESTLAQYCQAGKFGQCVWQVDDGSANNRMHVRNDATTTTNTFRSINVDGVNAQLDLVFTLNAPLKTALAYKVNNFNGASGGSIGTTDTTVNPPAVNALRLGQENVGLWLNGHIRSFKYYPRRLSDAKLQSITA
jgi:hypothetical protein